MNTRVLPTMQRDMRRPATCLQEMSNVTAPMVVKRGKSNLMLSIVSLKNCYRFLVVIRAAGLEISKFNFRWEHARKSRATQPRVAFPRGRRLSRAVSCSSITHYPLAEVRTLEFYNTDVTFFFQLLSLAVRPV